ncbi:MAG: bifunctional alpha,alpha-trehalose-phosphate synthase (UDP-forming)/trehalose-phosphatase [Desulfovibrio sp.]|nr:bifunctional alpha,alpha-trehalose-phosphate synthase (UDP-forming)/trehalose-phosphatase [Desulfovibrio sp.]
MKYVIISNRLPVSLVGEGDEFTLERSSGGVATGLDSLETATEKHWLGWPGVCVREAPAQARISAELKKQRLYPVWLSPEQMQDYYEGYCNSILWPLSHYFFSYIEYKEAYWEAYREVNGLFCREALKIIEPGDLVWIHDYHLMLLPGLIREQMPEVCIGYFHHIPFPSYELFRCLPERGEILRGLLGADVAGFHVHDYMRHFISSVYRVLNLDCRLDEVRLHNRVTRVEAFPMGINYSLYNEGPAGPEAAAFAEEVRKLVGECKIILSVDRLDYSKGILFRLESYAAFLDNNPEYKGRVTLIMIVVPSRYGVEKYAALKDGIDQMIGAINGAHSRVDWTPVHYFYRSFPFPELTALYHMADIALVTPLRDGMNLVAKEYLAAKGNRPGVIILSEMAGASVELSDALIVNPMDTKRMEKALLEALTMPEEEQLYALRGMQRTVSRHNVDKWADDFFAELREAKARNDAMREKLLEKDKILHLLDAYRLAEKRLLLLDYDGTLVPLAKRPAMAYPRPPLPEILAALVADPGNKVVVCSGRDRETLEKWLGPLHVDISAEHGAFFRENGVWGRMLEASPWDEEILNIMGKIADKTPRSMVERKTTALVWHYREVDPWLSDLRVTQLINALITPCTRLGLQIMQGNKIVEVKQAGFNKGTEVKRLLAKDAYDFYLAMGDDATDQDMFAALPPEAVTINVGFFSDAAMFYLPDQEQTLALLAAFVDYRAINA